MKADLSRRLLAELVGTALLVFLGAAALVAALQIGDGKLDHAGLGMVAFSFALVSAAVVSIAAPVHDAIARREP